MAEEKSCSKRTGKNFDFGYSMYLLGVLTVLIIILVFQFISAEDEKSIFYRIGEVCLIGQDYVVIDPGDTWLESGQIFEEEDYTLEYTNEEGDQGWYYNYHLGLKQVRLLPEAELTIVSLTERYIIVLFPYRKFALSRESIQEKTERFQFLPGTIEWEVMQKSPLQPYCVYRWRHGSDYLEGKLIFYT